MARIYRQLSDETKQKISQSLLNYHHNHKSTSDAMACRRRQSDAMAAYWRTIPNHSDDGDMRRYLDGK